MAFSEINGARIAWQQMGRGPDLIFVHGLAASRAFWFAAASRLQQTYRVTLFDWRGHGYSDRPDSGYNPLQFGRDILGLMDAAGIERAALAGHSYGGAAALEAAVIAPQRISHLALFDTRITRLQAQLRLHDAPLITEVEKEIAAEHDTDWASLPQVGYLFLETAARMRLAGKITKANDDFSPFGEGRGAVRAAKAWLDLLDQTSARNELDQAGAEQAQIAALNIPTLLMYGEYSRCLKTANELRAMWAHARYIKLAAAGHFFPIHQTEQVLPPLSELLTQ